MNDMTDKELARECLQLIDPASLQYDEWTAVGMAIKLAGLTAEDYDDWSRKDKRYKAGEPEKKWASFTRSEGVTIGTLVKLCRDQGREPTGARRQGEDIALDWDGTIGGHQEAPPLQVVRDEWLQDQPIPELPHDWNGKADLVKYLSEVYQSEERVGIVMQSYESSPGTDGHTRWLPQKGEWSRTAGELIMELQTKDIGNVLGDYSEQAGAWIRHNPLDGNGITDANVTAFRHCLVESDSVSIERQHAIYQELELPITALVTSGNKSLHAIVKIDAQDAKEFQKRVDFLYDVCKRNGLPIDRQNRNASRLSRLPGVMRNGKPQRLIATHTGKASWAEWADWIAAVNDDLPDVETLSTYLDNLPPLSLPLIDGLLRRGHKMLISGPSKAGKSFLLLELAMAIAEGKEWLGWQCERGRVLYVNLELDRASCYHRLADVYAALGWQPNHADDIDLWHLRGQAMAMDQLAPRLIRRAIKRRYAAVIIDPLYKVITGDENSADQMAKFCNQFDRVCHELGAAVIYCHHHSKGDQGQKRAHDRASGSGVFARDPDALLDMIELQIDDARRKQIVSRVEADAMAAAFDQEDPNWREDCPEDDATVGEKLATWATHNRLEDIMRAVRPGARALAESMSAWRIEGILREFQNFPARRCFFEYPIHTRNNLELIEDAKAVGEDIRRTPKQAGKAQADSTIEKTKTAILACKDERGICKTKDVMEYLDITKGTMSKRLKSAGYKTENGIISEVQND